MTALDLTPATLATLTMPQVLKRRADAHPGQLALREKVRGIWREMTWRDYFDNARRCAIGLYALGFRPGDRLIVLQDSGTLLRVPAEVAALTAGAVARAHAAFQALGQASDAQVSRFFDLFAARLEDDACWAPIAEAI